MLLIFLYVFINLICFPSLFPLSSIYWFRLLYVLFFPWLIWTFFSDLPFNLWIQPLPSFYIDIFFLLLLGNEIAYSSAKCSICLSSYSSIKIKLFVWIHFYYPSFALSLPSFWTLFCPLFTSTQIFKF